MPLTDTPTQLIARAQMNGLQPPRRKRERIVYGQLVRIRRWAERHGRSPWTGSRNLTKMVAVLPGRDVRSALSELVKRGYIDRTPIPSTCYGKLGYAYRARVDQELRPRTPAEIDRDYGTSRDMRCAHEKLFPLWFHEQKRLTEKARIEKWRILQGCSE